MTDLSPATTDTTTDAHAEVDALLERAWAERTRDAATALERCDEALAQARAADYRAGVAHSLFVRSHVYLRRSSPQAALADAHAALPYFEATGDLKRHEDTLNLLGVVYSELGDLGEALKYFLARYHLCEGRGDASEAEALQNLGYIHDYLGNHADALAYNLRSWQVCVACSDQEGETRLLNNIGYSYYRLGQHDAALEHYRKALALTEPDSSFYALLLDNMALAFEKQANLQDALDQQQRSLRLREAQDDKRGISYSLDSLGSIYWALGDPDRAQTCFEQSLALKTELGDKKGEAETLLLLGGLLAETGQTAQALPLLQTALEAATRSGGQDNIYAAHRALATVFKDASRPAEALFHFERYDEVKERTLSEAAQRALGSLRVQFETEQAEREREIYRLKNVELAQANLDLQALNGRTRELVAQLERQALEDALTGLANRRHADARLRAEFSRARRFGHSLSVAVCDIDDFKSINDTFSHQTGDEVLRTVARLLKTHLRAVDLVARYGGEEFLLLFPETSAQGALTVCRDLCRQVAAYPWDTVIPGLYVTLSVGLTDDMSVLNHEKLTALADAKLYEAKRAGKNRVKG